MSTFAAPLFTAERDGLRLRAFAAAGDDPSVPWLSVLDLAAAALVLREERVDLLAGIREGWLSSFVHDVLPGDGPVLAIEHGPAFLMLIVLGSASEASPERIDSAKELLEDATHGGSMACIVGQPRVVAERWLASAWRHDRAAYNAAASRIRPEVRP